MTVEELAALTRRRLEAHTRRVVPPGALVPAAVLVPIVDRGQPHIVFAKRTDRVGHHGGQVSFPGGIVDPGDRTSLDAALRECEEEIGLPRAAVEPLGVLDDTETFATQFVITPWVGRVREPVAWKPDGEEIEKVIEVPFATLVRADAFRVEIWEREGVRRPVYFLEYEGETIWGATARILRHYLALLTADPEPAAGAPDHPHRGDSVE
jgi:8-oxo-dGTP pyrophosphatase MutT (NUDIX family)